ncbi:MAG: aromatic-ring-hydroxylating dioxygenase subunit beta [Actinomycetota bacterium]|nr:aromatic-ring-hydroxylating dioxygenase subunit beta [Actinomycetota bacterium]
MTAADAPAGGVVNGDADLNAGSRSREPVGDGFVAPADLAEMWLFHRVSAFYQHEFGLLDGRQFEAWLALFTEDATYEVPMRSTTEEGGASEISPRGRIVWDTRGTLEVRVVRLRSGSAWAEQPPTRTRHHLTGLRITAVSGAEIETIANILVYCNRGDDAGHVLFSAERRDRLVKGGPEGFSIRSRVVVLDQANLPAPTLSVFL